MKFRTFLTYCVIIVLSVGLMLSSCEKKSIGKEIAADHERFEQLTASLQKEFAAMEEYYTEFSYKDAEVCMDKDTLIALRQFHFACMGENILELNEQLWQLYLEFPDAIPQVLEFTGGMMQAARNQARANVFNKLYKEQTSTGNYSCEDS